MNNVNKLFFQDRPCFRAAIDAAENKYEIAASKKGDPVAVRTSDGTWMSSRYDPAKEARRWVDAQEFKDDDLPLLLGFNPYILECLGPERVLVIENDASLLKAYLENVELDSVLENTVVVLDQDGQKLQAAVRVHFDPFKHSRVRICMGLQEKEQEWAARMAESALNIQRETSMNLLSFAYQLPKWIMTATKNMQTFLDSPDPSVLFGKFKGDHAIIVAAGPSLDRNIEELKNAKGRALIFAVDTALRALDAAGILPDACISVDTNPANARDVDGLSDEMLGVTLIADQIASAEIVDAFTGQKIFLRSINYVFDVEGNPTLSIQPIDEFIAELAGCTSLSSWQSGGSVSTNALNLAYLMGISDVILVGHDLAFTGGRTHVRGVGYEDDQALSSARFQTPEFKRWEQIALADVVVDSWEGNKVETNSLMREFLRWYDQTMEFGFGKDMKIIDATEGGALKRGMTKMTLVDAIKELPTESDVLVRLQNLLAAAPKAGKGAYEERRDEFYNKVEKIDNSPAEIALHLPLCRWLALPAYLGGRDLEPESKTELENQALLESARFLKALLMYARENSE